MRIYQLSPERGRVHDELVRIGVDPYALRMADKGLQCNILIKDVKTPVANILKQESIASGMDAAVKRGVVSFSVDYSDVLLLGSVNDYSRLIKRLKCQPFGIDKLARDIDDILKREKRPYFMAKQSKISIESPLLMGILNATPDSFSDGGAFIDEEDSFRRIDEMIVEGVDIIDIGGMSSRPDADYITADIEIERVSAALKYAVSKGAKVSIDTCNYETAQFAVDSGALIVNDITGLATLPMLDVVSGSGAAVCIMHMKGDPKNMQSDTGYDDIICDIQDFFSRRIDEALKAGIKEDSIILDVGFGFGKSMCQNFTLLKYMNEFNIFGLPLLAGVSRKSMIGASTGRPLKERVAGSIAAGTAALLNGCDIIRAHDTVETRDMVNIVNSVRKAKGL